MQNLAFDFRKLVCSFNSPTTTHNICPRWIGPFGHSTRPVSSSCFSKQNKVPEVYIDEKSDEIKRESRIFCFSSSS